LYYREDGKLDIFLDWDEEEFTNWAIDCNKKLVELSSSLLLNWYNLEMKEFKKVEFFFNSTELPSKCLRKIRLTSKNDEAFDINVND
jgi:hypothetical protein